MSGWHSDKQTLPTVFYQSNGEVRNSVDGISEFETWEASSE